MADENGDVKQASLEDSNMSNYGSQEHIDARKNAAKTEKEFIGAGQRPGLEIWRVENKRTANDTPDFGIKRWPKEDYGTFYSGDSYLVLNTYKDRESDKLLYDVHFWLGKDSSQDEIGVAAYKAVELDDLLDDGPVQHREVQGHESALFQSYFKGIQYLEGGIASGFRSVKPDEYKPRLFQVRRTRKTVRAFEVPVKVSSLNQGDVFILDAGLQVYIFIGDKSNAFEKMKGGALAHNLVGARQGKSRLCADLDDTFWRILGGSIADVKADEPHDLNGEDKPLELDKLKLFRLSDASGAITFTKEHEGKIVQSMLDPNDAFVLDAGIELFIWIGSGASQKEKSYAMKHAMEYLKQVGKPATTPITRVVQGQVHHVFGALVKAG